MSGWALKVGLPCSAFATGDGVEGGVREAEREMLRTAPAEVHVKPASSTMRPADPSQSVSLKVQALNSLLEFLARTRC